MIDTLRAKLKRLRWRNVSAPYCYRGAPDFVLKHGEPYDFYPLPDGVGPGAPRVCFANAIALATMARERGMDWHYVEGFALDPGLSLMPIHHAWVITEDGRLIDPTWWATGSPAYLGVTFSIERADDCNWNGDACVLDDFNRRWPLFKQPWPGENFEREWPASPRLEILRKRARGETITKADRVAAYEEYA